MTIVYLISLTQYNTTKRANVTTLSFTMRKPVNDSSATLIRLTPDFSAVDPECTKIWLINLEITLVS